jgi:hypothetical protein
MASMLATEDGALDHEFLDAMINQLRRYSAFLSSMMIRRVWILAFTR